MIAGSAAYQIKYYVLAVSEWFSHGLGRTYPFQGAGTKVWCRRASPVAANSGDRLLSKPKAGTQPWRREPRFM
jgi:hypothetical protein